MLIVILVAMETHNLDTTEGPLIYSAKHLADIRFKPLDQTQEYMTVEMMQMFSVCSKITLICHIRNS